MLSREKMGTGACGNGGRPVRTFGGSATATQHPSARSGLLKPGSGRSQPELWRFTSPLAQKEEWSKP